MWSANISIINTHELTNKSFKVEFYPLMKYTELDKELSSLVPDIDLDQYRIEYIFNFLDKKILIEDLDKYVLNNDFVDVVLTLDLSEFYILYDSFDYSEIMKTSDINKIYSFYQRIKTHDFPLMIYRIKCKKAKLIDVLEDSNHHMNSCINRMVHKYGQIGF